MISSFEVRPPRSADELADHLNGYVEVRESRSPEAKAGETAERLQIRLTTLPGYRHEQIRSAYRNGELVGGYRMYERRLRVGAARLATGCIGGVYTCRHARLQGVASALMYDAIAYAQAHDYPLLLLDGIPHFYHRFGYEDVFDFSAQEVDREAVLALPRSPYRVRPPTLDDAGAVLGLYDRHFGPYTGSFERSIEEQTHRMEYQEPESLWLAIDPDGSVRGYLALDTAQPLGPYALAGTELWELAADDWSAASSLLQYHARAVHGSEGRDGRVPALYAVPPMSPLVRWMADHLDVTDISSWYMPMLGWAVREQTFRHRDAGWMARLASLPALIRAMLPEWQDRWERSMARWRGDISLIVGEGGFTLRIDGREVALLDEPGETAQSLVLAPGGFTQAVFGYVPVTDALQPSGRPLPADLATALAILFPLGQTWIPTSDWF